MRQPRAVITGLGVMSPLGCALKVYWAGLLQGRAAFRPHRNGSSRSHLVGLVEPEAHADLAPASRSWATVDKLSKLMCMAARAAIKDAGLEAGAADLDRVGVVVGTGLSTVATNASFIRSSFADHPRFVSPVDFANATPNTPAAQVAIHLGFRGPNTTVSTGESSGLRALSYAIDLLEQGQADALVVGACEEVTPFALERLALEGDLAEGRQTPFDRRRRGTLAAEGAACLVLESGARAADRKARVRAEVLGEAHETVHEGGAPDTVARGAATLRLTMSRALRHSGLELRDVDYVSGSSNGSRLTDAIELSALEAAGEEGDTFVHVGSIKSTLGETYGASGLFQVAAACLSMERGEVPPDPWLEEPDTASLRLTFHRERAPMSVRTTLVNAFEARGGYASVVLARAPEARS